MSKMHSSRRSYLLELGGSFALYGAVLAASVTYVNSMPDSPLRTAISVSPMLPLMLGICAVVRQFRRIDEYLRLKSMEDVLIAAAVTAGATFTYGFLENVGFPRLSMFTVWPLMGGVWGLSSCVRGMLERQRLPRP